MCWRQSLAEKAETPRQRIRGRGVSLFKSERAQIHIDADGDAIVLNLTSCVDEGQSGLAMGRDARNRSQIDV